MCVFSIIVFFGKYFNKAFSTSVVSVRPSTTACALAWIKRFAFRKRVTRWVEVVVILNILQLIVVLVNSSSHVYTLKDAYSYFTFGCWNSHGVSGSKQFDIGDTPPRTICVFWYSPFLCHHRITPGWSWISVSFLPHQLHFYGLFHAPER